MSNIYIYICKECGAPREPKVPIPLCRPCYRKYINTKQKEYRTLRKERLRNLVHD